MTTVDEFKIINPNWKISDTLTVWQAAALIAGFDPNFLCFDENGLISHFRSESNFTDNIGVNSVKTTFAALINSINQKKLKANLRYDAEPRYLGGLDMLYERSYWKGEDVSEGTDQYGASYVVKPEPNWRETTLERTDLREWLSCRGFRTGFFFPDDTDEPEYLNKNHSKYAPKLCAAVKAWQAVVKDDSALTGKTPKQALTKWLREHASEFELTDDEGRVNEQGIDEIAKIANWKLTGGVPKTPGNS